MDKFTVDLRSAPGIYIGGWPPDFHFGLPMELATTINKCSKAIRALTNTSREEAMSVHANIFGPKPIPCHYSFEEIINAHNTSSRKPHLADAIMMAKKVYDFLLLEGMVVNFNLPDLKKMRCYKRG